MKKVVTLLVLEALMLVACFGMVTDMFVPSHPPLTMEEPWGLGDE